MEPLRKELAEGVFLTYVPAAKFKTGVLGAQLITPLEESTVAAGALPNESQLKLTATKFVTALEDTDENWRDVRAVGALCGVNTGTLENCALTRGTNSSTSALVAAALAFGDSTTATQRKAQTQKAGNKSYTYYTDEPRGIGGLVGVAIPKT